MLGLKKIPSDKQLLLAYQSLVTVDVLPQINLLCLYTQWSRFDARLGELLTKFFADHWQQINPVALNTSIQQQPWPPVLGVLLNQSLLLLRSQSKPAETIEFFNKWKNLGLHKVRPANLQLFFIGLLKPGGKIMKQEVLQAKNVYTDWGYFGKDILINKYNNKSKTFIDLRSRLDILGKFRASKKPFRVEDYVSALDGGVSRRQAQRDIQNFPGLKSKGYTRNKVFVGTN